jgi:predicted TIM-barrel fold metal-dependent hydrolase
MEDVRTQHQLMRVPPVDISPLAGLVKNEPELRLVLLNWAPAIPPSRLQTIVSRGGRVYFDISTVEGVGGVTRLVRQVSLERVLFGSNYPLFYFESAVLKVQESDLNEAQKNALFEGNARLLAARHEAFPGRKQGSSDKAGASSRTRPRIDLESS